MVFGCFHTCFKRGTQRRNDPSNEELVPGGAPHASASKAGGSAYVAPTQRYSISGSNKGFGSSEHLSNGLDGFVVQKRLPERGCVEALIGREKPDGALVLRREFAYAKDDEAMVRIDAELKMLKRLKHVNINVHVSHRIDRALTGEARLFVTVHHRDSLADVLASSAGQGLPESDIRRLAKDAAWGLAFLHAQGIVHRRICPDNLMLSAAGRVEVAGFGSFYPPVAVAYQAPEAFLQDECTEYSDVWGLAATITELATGHRPYSNSSHHVPEKTLHVRLADASKPFCHPLPPSHFSDAGQQMLRKCFRPVPTARPTFKSLLISVFLCDPGIPLPGELPSPSASQSQSKSSTAAAE